MHTQRWWLTLGRKKETIREVKESFDYTVVCFFSFLKMKKIQQKVKVCYIGGRYMGVYPVFYMSTLF